MSEPKHPPPRPDGSPPAAGTSAAVVTAEALFAGRREVIIEHAGVRYLLRLTRRNKLILQK